jgi:hypothetical protein
MALFNLTDIAYKRGEQRNFKPFAIRESLRPDLTTTRYPSDLGSTDRGHYMLIHINVQEKTSYKYTADEGNLPTIQRNRIGLKNQTGATNIGGFGALGVDNLKRFGTFVGENTPDAFRQGLERLTTGVSSFIAEKVAPTLSTGEFDSEIAAAQRAARGASAAVRGALTGAEQLVGNLDNQSFLRKIKRTKSSIALYMPGTMAYTHNQQYNQLQMGGEPAAFFGAGMSLITDAINKGDPKQLGTNLTPFILEKIKNLSSPFIGTNSATGIFASAIGGVQNPQLELIYSSPSFRTFRFDFMFYPSNEEEAQDVQYIIQQLKFHQAPEIMAASAGYFLVPPSEFDIEFYYNGEINPNIPRISTCVLTSIDMDYAPKGFVAYEVPNQNTPTVGGTGMPFAIRLSLSFQETEIMTKYNFESIEEMPRSN